MKKILTILLSVLMVATLGIVNVSADTSVTLACAGATWDDSEKDLSFAALTYGDKETVTVTLSGFDEGTELTGSATGGLAVNKNATIKTGTGTTTVEVEIEATAATDESSVITYKNGDDKVFTITVNEISKKELTAEALSVEAVKGLTYTGKAQQLYSATELDGVTYSYYYYYKDTPSDSKTVTNVEDVLGTKAGDYVVRVSAVASSDGNYSGSVANKYVYSYLTYGCGIKQAKYDLAPSETLGEGNTIVYDGEKHVMSYSYVGVNDEEVNGALTYDLSKDYTNVGEYTTTTTFTDGFTNNYEEVADAYKTAVVNYSIIAVTPVANVTAKTNLIYTGENQELLDEHTFTGIVAGENEDNKVKLQYKVDDGEWSDDLPVGKNAGAYVVSYKIVSDNPNYNSVEAQELTVVIAESTNNAINTAKTTSTYYKNLKGTATIKSNGVKDDFTGLYVSVDDGAYTLVDADNYTVTEGSTIVTLKETYLQTLTVGKDYSFQLRFNDNYATDPSTVLAVRNYVYTPASGSGSGSGSGSTTKTTTTAKAVVNTSAR